MKHQSHSHRVIVGLLAVAFVLLAALPIASAKPAEADALQAVQAAWQRAQQSGAYHFTSEVVQTTYPAPAVANTGRTTRVDRLHLDGQTNMPARQFQLMVRDGGNLLNTADTLEVRIDGDQSMGRTAGGEWQTIENFTDAFAPGGSDLMVYLSGVKDVQVQANPASFPDSVGTLYQFELDGPALARYLRDQLELYLIQKGELPANLSLESPNLYRDATGQGQIWVTADGLPKRLSLKIQYPRESNGAQVEAELKTDFSDYAPVVGAAPIDQLARSLGLPRTANDWQQVGLQGTALMSGAGFMFLLIRNRRSRKLYSAVVMAVILALVVSPLFDSQRAAAYFDQRAAKQTENDQQREEQDAARKAQAELEASTWNPHQDPLAE
ncbi:MAG: hypothetical protein KA765_13935, partial [Thermoflexales bacterium]|nr:hypothetical protein [Thermoflexales bacterium]